jgi:hypothetical protein
VKKPRIIALSCFVVCMLLSNYFCSQKNAKITSAAAKINIGNAYKSWVKQQVESGKYYTQSQWDSIVAPIDMYKVIMEDQSIDVDLRNGLPDTIDKIVYGDLNGDKVLDAAVFIWPTYYSPGTWSLGVRPIGLFFISSTANSYEVLPEKEGLYEEVGLGIITRITKDGTIVYEFEPGYGDRYDPYEPRLVKYKYENHSFVKQK